MAGQNSGRTLDVRIWRGDAKGGRFTRYDVPARASQTVLDVVTWVQRHLDTSLSYRFACRVGMCGSCAMTVNGEPRWTCRSHVDKVAPGGMLEISPLRNLPVIKDLATDMAPFFDKWREADARFCGTSDRTQDTARVSSDSRRRRAADAGIECINCGICYAACDVVAWNQDYPGPAALNRAWTLVNDERDADRDGHLQAVAGPAGCHNCHSHQNCTRYCPNELNPTAAIAGLKRASVAALLGRGQ